MSIYTDHFQISTRTCFTVVCSRCPADDPGPHFDDETELTQWLAEEKWEVTADGYLMCAEHIQAAQCERRGHQWLPWSTGLSGPVQVRSCDHCSACEYAQITTPALDLAPLGQGMLARFS